MKLVASHAFYSVMDDAVMRYGSLILIAACACLAHSTFGATPPDDLLLPKAQAKRFDISYEVNDEAQPIERIELWYTFDEGSTWQLYGVDQDRVSPMTFCAPQEGLCGVYFVVSNAAGPSSDVPSKDTDPHIWVFVDYTLPIAQVHPPELVYRPANYRVAQISWTAVDANLPSRPIDLSYRLLPDGEWTDIRHRLPNSGRYDWRVPVDVVGQAMLRMTVADRGGNRVHCSSSEFSFDAAPAVPPVQGLGHELAGNGERGITVRERKRARELLQKGRWHVLRNEQELAASRFRDALALDPQLTEALVKLGGCMYSLRRYSESASAFDLALQQMPTDRDALDGYARTLVALKNYDAAETKLLSIVEYNPNDVEAWLHLGDVSIYRGNEIGARDYYTKAMTLRPEAEAIVAKARSRLEDLPSLRRRYNDQNE